MKATLFLLLALGCLVSLRAPAQSGMDLEAGVVFPGSIDVAIPGDAGTRFSLTDDLDAESEPAFRGRYGWRISDRHWLGLLVAPLSVTSRGTFGEDTEFNGTSFPAGRPVEATYRFDSYRLLYRYRLLRTDRWQFSLGGALKIRDASITVEGEGLRSEKENTGAVPLLSFNLLWTPFRKVGFLIDGEALAAPQGRAEDVLFAIRYEVNDSLALKAGYRVLEGGADNDEVYTFSLFHYAVAGLDWTF